MAGPGSSRTMGTQLTVSEPAPGKSIAATLENYGKWTLTKLSRGEIAHRHRQ